MSGRATVTHPSIKDVHINFLMLADDNRNNKHTTTQLIDVKRVATL